jgi:hypothetical protein
VKKQKMMIVAAGLVLLMFIGSMFVVEIANSLSRSNPMRFWLVPVYMFSVFALLVFFLGRASGRTRSQDPVEEDHETFIERLEEEEDRTPEQSRRLETRERVRDETGKRATEDTASQEKKFPPLLGIWIVLFLVVMAISLPWGGTAVNGKILEGKFLLGEHGEYTEVGRFKFVISGLMTAGLGLFAPFAVYSLRNRAKQGEKAFATFFVIASALVGSMFFLKSIGMVLKALTYRPG